MALLTLSLTSLLYACLLLRPADDYNLGQVLNVSLQFFEAQRSGKLPRISNTPWRGNSGLWDSVLLPNGKNYSLLGGWYDDGGMLKLSYTTAFTVSMLSWAFYEFKGGYRASGNADFSANTIRWGADYLMKVSVTNITSAGTAMQPIFVAQVRNMLLHCSYAVFLQQQRTANSTACLSVCGSSRLLVLAGFLCWLVWFCTTRTAMLPIVDHGNTV